MQPGNARKLWYEFHWCEAADHLQLGLKPPPAVIGDDFRKVTRAFLVGLEDYSTDQRGDVGSWIRLACIKGLHEITTSLLTSTLYEPLLPDWLPSSTFTEVTAGILKQSVERIDQVRSEAGERLLSLCTAAASSHLASFTAPILAAFLEADQQRPAPDAWRSLEWVFGHSIDLLGVQYLHASLLEGLVYSLGAGTSAAVRLDAQLV